MRAALVSAALTALAASACVVSFDGYELGSGGGSAGAPAGGAGGGSGGTITAGSGGAATGGSSGSATGGSGGATGGSGGTTGGAGGATGGSGGATGGSAGTTGGSGGATGGSGGTTGGSGGTTGGSGGATGGTGGATGGTGGGPTCPGGGGTAQMLAMPGGCIDKTEVTQEQYSAWLGGSPSTSGQPTGCSGNTSFVPSCNYNPVTTANKPVVCVDWCDAFAYCKAAGKRLCGAIGGGTVAPASNTDPAKSQWHLACTQNGTRTYPYGSIFDKLACVGLDNNNFIATQNVGSVPTCQGGYPLLYDMSGNAAEWEDSCETNGDCYARGGHYLSVPADLACAAKPKFPRMSHDKSRGFRCCAD